VAEASARAASGQDGAEATAFAGPFKDLLWDGPVDQVVAWLPAHAERVGPPQEACEGPDHPRRRVLANNVGSFEAHRHDMDYPRYRARGWPIGSGMTESGVKPFNKRIKGTDPFWSEPGGEAIRDRHWNNRPAYRKTA
jgi:hypothetical protein